MSARTQAVIGRIVAVQEQRFRLATADGKNVLLTLATHARITGGDLAHYRDQGRLVRVEFTGEPGLASGSAHRIEAI